MRSLLLYCLLMLVCIPARCVEAGNIDSLFRALNKGEVSVSARPLLFSDFSITKNGDTTCYSVGDNIENVFISYCQEATDNYAIDMLEVNARCYRLFASPEHDKMLDMHVEEALLYHIRTKERRYVCITGRVTNDRAGKDRITSFVLIDITDPGKVKIGQLLSYCSSIYSFGDFNNDGELDFLKVKPEPRGKGFIAEACNLDGDKIKLGSKKGYSLSMGITEGIATITDSNWFTN